LYLATVFVLTALDAPKNERNTDRLCEYCIQDQWQKSKGISPSHHTRLMMILMRGVWQNY
jgi:hypothetical protein